MGYSAGAHFDMDQIALPVQLVWDVPVEGHGDDTPLTSHDTPLFSLLILLVHVSKFNVHDTLMTLPLRLA